MADSTKRIDPKRIEEWERLSSNVLDGLRVAAERYPGYDDATQRELANAVPALLSEREDLLSLLREAKTVLENLPFDCRPWTAVEILREVAAYLRET